MATALTGFQKCPQSAVKIVAVRSFFLNQVWYVQILRTRNTWRHRHAASPAVHAFPSFFTFRNVDSTLQVFFLLVFPFSLFLGFHAVVLFPFIHDSTLCNFLGSTLCSWGWGWGIGRLITRELAKEKVLFIFLENGPSPYFLPGLKYRLFGLLRLAIPDT